MKNKSHRFDINRPTILDKIFEIKQSNPVKLGRTRKVDICFSCYSLILSLKSFLRRFLLVLPTKYLFWEYMFRLLYKLLFHTFFWISYLFRTATFREDFLFQKSHFFAAVIFFRIAYFSERNFYKAATS